MTSPKSYFRPKTLAEAIQRSVQHGSIAISGGALAFGGLDVPYDTVIDLQDLRDWGQITQDDDGVHLGGICSLQEVVEAPLVHTKLKAALTRSLPLNLRHGASVGESVIVKQPPVEWLAVLIALDAQVEHAGHLQGLDKSPLWEQPLEEFIQFLHLHRHPYQGIITQVRLPPLNAHTVTGTAFVSRTPADSPIVNAAVRVNFEHERVAFAIAVLGGASHTPLTVISLDMLIGNPLNSAQIAKAAAMVEESVHPEANYLGNVEYRCAMARLCVQRALEDCSNQHLASG